MAKKRVSKKSSTAASKKKASTTARKAATRPATRKSASRVTKRAPEAPLEHLERLISMMVEKDVVEVEYESSGTRWRVRRAEAHGVPYAPQQAIPMPVAPVAPVVGGPAGATPAPSPAESAGVEPEGEVFKSPMVGTFYRAPAPDAEPFCKVGDRVSSDRTLCIIEAMKVMNEIKAEREFEILDVLVKNGESVEFGQPLFLIR